MLGLYVLLTIIVFIIIICEINKRLYVGLDKAFLKHVTCHSTYYESKNKKNEKN